MTTIKEAALNYKSKQTLNIADLPEVSVEAQTVERTGINTDGKEFSYEVIEVNGNDYRVPGSVIGQIQAILQENKNLKTFKVKKTGTGLATQYTVIPLS